MIIDHISIGVADYEKSKTFFCQALAPLGIELIVEVGGWAGFGRAPKPEFWFGKARTRSGAATHRLHRRETDLR